MTQYSRTPSVLILLARLALAVVYACCAPARTDASLNGDGSRTLEQLERAIAATNADAQTWFQYAGLLRERKRFADAALAFEKVLEQEPFNREARFRCATSLALAGDEDDFYDFLRELTYSDAKLSVELLARRECQVYLGQSRFQALQNEARSQAMD